MDAAIEESKDDPDYFLEDEDDPMTGSECEDKTTAKANNNSKDNNIDYASLPSIE